MFSFVKVELRLLKHQWDHLMVLILVLNLISFCLQVFNIPSILLSVENFDASNHFDLDFSQPKKILLF
jgi:hypothetical protein